MATITPYFQKVHSLRALPVATLVNSLDFAMATYRADKKRGLTQCVRELPDGSIGSGVPSTPDFDQLDLERRIAGVVYKMVDLVNQLRVLGACLDDDDPNTAPCAGVERITAGKKRALEEDHEDDEPYSYIGMPMDKNCDQVRRMINAFIENGEMKVTEMQRELNITSKTWYSFMNQSGPSKGQGCDLYHKAYDFFKKREQQGIPLPRKKTKRTPLSDTTANSTSKANTGVKIPGSETAGMDLSAIRLEGEESDSVPIYETCAEVRKKIAMHLKKENVVQAAFLRDMCAQFHKEQKKIQSVQLDRFRGQSGATGGATNPVYYGAYCFFEKLRIAQKKPKSKHRLEMESIYGKDGGVDTTRDPSRSYWTCLGSERPYQDEFGRMSFH